MAVVVAVVAALAAPLVGGSGGALVVCNEVEVVRETSSRGCIAANAMRRDDAVARKSTIGWRESSEWREIL